MRVPSKKNNLAFLNPDLEKEWDYDGNYLLKPYSVLKYSQKKV